MAEHVEVLIVGAGLSGIGAAVHLSRDCPGTSYAIVEARDAIGGTWDLFRYPGIRSDSDMFTMGYRFKPWTDNRTLADGPAILSYVREAAAEHDVERHIRYGLKVVGASWSTEEAHWTITAQHTGDGDTVELTCDFLYLNSGYYDYDGGYLPEFPGIEAYEGTLVHPQHWPEDLDYAGKRVLVIGSGATAVTLVPAMAGTAEHVTMLQRSPTYIVALPGEDPIARFVRRFVPARQAYFVLRWKNVLLQMAQFRLSKRYPKVVKAAIRKAAARLLPEGYAMDPNFRPKYNPWDERMCVVPDGDLFKALSHGSAELVTDTIETFTPGGVRLASGREIEADIVITATGLQMKVMAGLTFVVDGREIDLPSTLAYKAIMLEDVPNMAFTVGYTNASWTLKADIAAEWVCRLLNHMDAEGYDVAVPVNHDPAVRPEPFMNLSSGYVQRAAPMLPKQGSKAPWRLDMNYAKDIVTLRHRPIEDGVLEFSRVRDRAPAEPVGV